MPHSTDLVEDDQEWDFVSGVEELSLYEKEILVPATYYTMKIGNYTREITRHDIEDRNHHFVDHFDEELRFKHNYWPESTKRIILGYILYRDVLKELKAKDPQKRRLLHFISLLKFREHAGRIKALDLRLTAETELAHAASDVPFADILRYIVRRPEWSAFDKDNSLLMLLVQRLNAWSVKIPDVETSQIIKDWPGKDVANPANIILKIAIQLKLELQGCQQIIRDMAMPFP
ncbi:hypothetical protein FAVG1_07082 [Fusarium avenaceum]|nr:hypothetical protein FAVG1_07082 [Fusarium avenaceum]